MLIHVLRLGFIQINILETICNKSRAYVDLFYLRLFSLIIFLFVQCLITAKL